MKKLLFIILLFTFETAIFAQKQNSEYVNPFIGTGGHGHTYPGVTAPFAMLQLSPDTRLDGWDGCSGYHFSDSLVYGFSHTHLSGTGVPDYADILLMPTSGEIRLNNGADGKAGYRSHFLKTKEKATIDQYETYLEDYKIKVSLTANMHTGFHTYIYDNEKDKNIILDLLHRDEILDADFQQINKTTVQGYRISKAWAKEQKIYFYLQFSTPVKLEKTIQRNNKNVVGGFRIKDKKEKNIRVTVAISPISMENAKKNFEAENGKTQTQEWQNLLSKIEIESPNEDDKTNFYTALFHLYSVPNTIQDVDNQYLGTDLKAHEAKDYTHYTVFSLWDTYRAAHPLYTILQPKRVNDFVKTFIDDFDKSGALPMWTLAGNETWCMIGNHAIPVITDAYLKGLLKNNTTDIKSFDNLQANTKLLDAMIKTTEINHFGQKEYAETGFIPAELEHESVSKTIEYAYDDYCIYKMASALNKDDIAKKYLLRSLSYRNVFNPKNGFSQAKTNNTWVTPFAPAEVNSHFTEGNSWHYSFSAPHDMDAWVNLLGGKKAAETKLDALFSADTRTSGREQSDITGLIGQYAHGNEPSHHISYLYDFVGKPHKTQAIVHQIMSDFYKNTPDGLIGNEDCGQMSAWYIFSAMGFYPVNPCGGEYVIGTPRFPSMKINLENDKSFTIKAQNISEKNFYIQSVTLNGTALDVPFIQHQDIMNGGELIFTMGDTPSNWGVLKDKKATSEKNNKEVKWRNSFVPKSFVAQGYRSFMDSTSVILGNADERTKVYYSINGFEPELYKTPILINETSEINFWAIKEGFKNFDINSRTSTSIFSKIPINRSIILKNKYATQYAASGNNALIDFIKGNKNYHTGAWQGYEGIDCEVIIDLKKETSFSKIAVGVLQDNNAWIFSPTQIEIFTSADGVTFQPFDVIKSNIDEHTEGAIVQDFSSIKRGNTRFMKIIAKNRGVCPDWHKGKGYKSWIFLDEISIE